MGVYDCTYPCSISFWILFIGMKDMDIKESNDAQEYTGKEEDKMTPEKFSVYFMLISVVVFSIGWIVSAIRRTVKRKKILREGNEVMATLKEEDGTRGRWVYYEYKVRGKTYLAKTRRDFIRENNDVEMILYEDDCPDKYIFKYGIYERRSLSIKYTLELLWIVCGMLVIWAVADRYMG